jgi:hypothetical protein
MRSARALAEHSGAGATQPFGACLRLEATGEGAGCHTRGRVCSPKLNCMVAVKAVANPQARLNETLRERDRISITASNSHLHGFAASGHADALLSTLLTVIARPCFEPESSTLPALNCFYRRWPSSVVVDVPSVMLPWSLGSVLNKSRLSSRINGGCLRRLTRNWAKPA